MSERILMYICEDSTFMRYGRMWGNINFVLERDFNQTISAVPIMYELNSEDGS